MAFQIVGLITTNNKETAARLFFSWDPYLLHLVLLSNTLIPSECILCFIGSTDPSVFLSFCLTPVPLHPLGSTQAPCRLGQTLGHLVNKCLLSILLTPACKTAHLLYDYGYGLMSTRFLVLFSS